jgi:hypothetical protein
LGEEELLGMVEESTKENRVFLVGSHISLADLLVFS